MLGGVAGGVDGLWVVVRLGLSGIWSLFFANIVVQSLIISLKRTHILKQRIHRTHKGNDVPVLRILIGSRRIDENEIVMRYFLLLNNLIDSLIGLAVNLLLTRNLNVKKRSGLR